MDIIFLISLLVSNFPVCIAADYIITQQFCFSHDDAFETHVYRYLKDCVSGLWKRDSTKI